MAKISFKSKVQIMIFPDKQKVRKFVTIIPAVQGILKGVLQVEIKKKKTLESKLKSYEEIKISLKSKYMFNYKIHIIASVASNSTFCFLYN